MNDATIQAFRNIAEAMLPASVDWQWIGPYMSQRMFGITRKRAEEYATKHGGEARPMKAAGYCEFCGVDGRCVVCR